VTIVNTTLELARIFLLPGREHQDKTKQMIPVVYNSSWYHMFSCLLNDTHRFTQNCCWA